MFLFDGHIKLIGFQNCTFPTAIYGCLDTATRKLAGIVIAHSIFYLVGAFYYLHESKLLSNYVRLDSGRKTGVLATIHAYLRR